MSLIYSKAEVQKQLKALSENVDAIYMTDWERNFIDEVSQLMFISLSEKQLQTISKIYVQRFE